MEYIRRFLKEYTKQNDFWEVMNAKLVNSLAHDFLEIEGITSTFSLAPDRVLNFPRESTVRYERGALLLKEYFKFTRLNYLICQKTFQSLNLHVSWEMKVKPNLATDYPDYQWVDQVLRDFFAKNPVSMSNWKKLKTILIAHLLGKFSSLVSVDIEITVVE